MKMRLALLVFIACILTFFAFGSITQIPKDQLVVEAKTNDFNFTDIENKLESKKLAFNVSQSMAEQIAVDAFKSYFNIEMNEKKLYKSVNNFNSKGQELWLITWSSQNKQYINIAKDENYRALVDANSGKVLDIGYYKLNDIKKEKFSIEELEKITHSFIEKNRILDVNKMKFKYEESKEVSDNGGGYFYYLYYEYEGYKTLLVTVDKADRKVNSFIFFDEINANG